MRAIFEAQSRFRTSVNNDLSPTGAVLTLQPNDVVSVRPSDTPPCRRSQ